MCQIVNTGLSTDDNLNETLKKFWEVTKVPEELDENDAIDVQKHSQDIIIFNPDKQIRCKTPMEGHQTKSFNKFYSGEKAIKQPTYFTEKRSTTHQQIQ